MNKFKTVISYQYLDILSIKKLYGVKRVKKNDKKNSKTAIN